MQISLEEEKHFFRLEVRQESLYQMCFHKRITDSSGKRLIIILIDHGTASRPFTGIAVNEAIHIKQI
jgi:hypothetical protein